MSTLFISIVSSFIGCLSLQLLQQNFPVSVFLYPNSNFLLQFVEFLPKNEVKVSRTLMSISGSMCDLILSLNYY